MSKHNKKRNVGIVYELLLRHISNCLIENRKKDAQKALNIIEKRFKKGTELYKEFRLFNALAKSTVSGSHVAAAVLQEAKNAARSSNSKKLDIEKSNLIKDINYKIDDKNFYYRNVPEYKDYATIQVVLNEWRSGADCNLSKLIEYENKVVKRLIEEKVSRNESTHEPFEHDALIFKLMTEKINQKYGKDLNAEQKKIINYYTFNASDTDKIRNFLNEIKSQTIQDLKEFKNNNQNDFIDQKINKVYDAISNLKTESIDDDLVSKFLIVSKLKQEISGD